MLMNLGSIFPKELMTCQNNAFFGVTTYTGFPPSEFCWPLAAWGTKYKFLDDLAIKMRGPLVT
jgi:hypothetical protein